MIYVEITYYYNGKKNRVTFKYFTEDTIEACFSALNDVKSCKDGQYEIIEIKVKHKV